MVSCWSSSGLLYGEIPTKHRVQRINKCSGQVAMPRCLPLVGKFDTVYYDRLRACCITLHHMQSSGARPQEWIWGCLGVLCWFMTPPQLPLMWMSHVRPSRTVESYSWANLCKAGWVFTAYDQRSWHIHKTLHLPLGCGESLQAWPQQMSLWIVASHTMNPATADFQGSFWVWLSRECIILSQPCLFHPRPEINGQ